ncbi:N-acetylglucosamine-6-phosphate deacetylase [Psychromonas antarctica]|uniref:N-acetylglucosamine-6-phosphate deacetylase n=1 Tax=Psychromonas antarctica TaxID=67573 RepID=UPI001EE7A702|nr:N-acetylglucosamine-6-phosphate deacetylase [Psychromonas antarctica]MCG6200292.1 N-acetylglucosamine-6-phosphate deacetylase [Psychromonas antarctica]
MEKFVMYALTNCTIYTTQAILTDHAVVIENDKIKSIKPISALDANTKMINLNGANLCPGFIDLQINGCGGVMFNGNISEQTLNIMQAANLKSGCTSYLPTLITSSDADIIAALKVARNFIDKTANEVLGLHLEGPFISLEKKGIHRPEFIRKPDQEMVDLICANADIVTKVTIAPENSPLEVIKQLNDAGIVVSIGHSNATYAQAKAAIDNGATFATHLFNAMSPMTGREPGVIGAIYDHQIYAGIIVDGIHVAYPNVRISKKILGEKLILVTDATSPVGANIDQFDFVGTTVYYKKGKCFRQDGTLGGSALTMIESIEKCVKFADIELSEAIRMATLYPARAISVANKLGSIEADKIANLTIFNNDYKVIATVVNGYYQNS